MEINISIKGMPEAKQSARFTKSGIAFQPKKVVNYKDNLRYQIIAQLPKGFVPFSNPVEIIYQFIFPFLSTHSRKKRSAGKLFKATKPDLDNLQKSTNDAMNNVVFYDDSQICSASIEKFYGEVPGINISIRSVEL